MRRASDHGQRSETAGTSSRDRDNGHAAHTGTGRRVTWLGLAILVSAAIAISPVEAKKKRAAKPPAAEAAQDQKATPPEPQPYRPKLMRLAEILGALTSLDELCRQGQGVEWRGSMQALIEAQARSHLDEEELAGAFNRGYRGYQLSYRACTANARMALGHFLGEGRRILREVVDRYGSS